MNSMKRQKDMTRKDELPKLVGAQYATGEERKNSFRGMKMLSQSQNNDQLWMCLVVKIKPDAVKNILHRNLQCYIHESRQIGSGQIGDGKNEH